MKLQDGIYLIIDPSMDSQALLNKLTEIIHERIAGLQIWDNFRPDQDPLVLVEKIVQLCHSAKVPVLINNRWELLLKTDLDGVHFDKIPDNLQQVKADVKRSIIRGITCNNDLSVVKWADENHFDYVSFCSMFPSSTANSCELVAFDTVKEARRMTSLSIFLAGGIRPENMEQLNELSYSGVAVVSGIMSAEKPIEEIKKYHQKIKSSVL